MVEKLDEFFFGDQFRKHVVLISAALGGQLLAVPFLQMVGMRQYLLLALGLSIAITLPITILYDRIRAKIPKLGIDDGVLRANLRAFAFSRLRRGRTSLQSELAEALHSIDERLQRIEARDPVDWLSQLASILQRQYTYILPNKEGQYVFSESGIPTSGVPLVNRIPQPVSALDCLYQEVIESLYSNNLYDRANALVSIGFIRTLQGANQEALERLRSALAIYKTIDVPINTKEIVLPIIEQMIQLLSNIPKNPS